MVSAARGRGAELQGHDDLLAAGFGGLDWLPRSLSLSFAEEAALSIEVPYDELRNNLLDLLNATAHIGMARHRAEGHSPPAADDKSSAR